MNQTEERLIDLKVGCPACGYHEVRVDQPQAVPTPCNNCGNQTLEIVWTALVEGPEDEFCGF